MGRHRSGELSPREPDTSFGGDDYSRFAPTHGMHAERNPEMDHSTQAFYKDVAKVVSQYGALHDRSADDTEPAPEVHIPTEIANLVAAIHKQGEHSADSLLGRGIDRAEMSARGVISDALRQTAAFVAPISWVNPAREANIVDTEVTDDIDTAVIVSHLQEVLGYVSDELGPESRPEAEDIPGTHTGITRFTGIRLKAVRTPANAEVNQAHDHLTISLVRESASDDVSN